MKRFAYLTSYSSDIDVDCSFQLKEAMEDIDIISTHDNCSLYGVWALLSGSLVDKYEYIGFDFNQVDSVWLDQTFITPQLLVAYIEFLASCFLYSKSVPIFIIQPCFGLHLSKSASWVWRGVGRVLGIPVLDLEAKLSRNNLNEIMGNVKPGKMTPSFKKIVSADIAAFLEHGPTWNSDRDYQSIKFLCGQAEVFAPTADSKVLADIPFQPNLRRIGPEAKLGIGSNFYLVGAVYSNCKASSRLPWLQWHTANLRIAKDISVGYGEESLVALPIGVSVRGGESGGVVSFTKTPSGMEEKALNTALSTNPVLDSVWVNSLLLANENPWKHGEAFVVDHSSIFEEERMHQLKIAADAEKYSLLPIPSQMSHNFFEHKVRNTTLNVYVAVAWYIRELFPVGKHKLTILDVGSRSADGANFLGNLYDPQSFARITADVYACDIKDRDAAYAKKYMPFIKDYIVGDVTKETEKYDLIVASHVIEHVPNPYDFVMALRARINKYLIIYCPYMEKQSYGKNIPGHISNIDINFIFGMPVINLRILYSNVYHQAPCCIFALPPL